VPNSHSTDAINGRVVLFHRNICLMPDFCSALSSPCPCHLLQMLLRFLYSYCSVEEILLLTCNPGIGSMHRKCGITHYHTPASVMLCLSDSLLKYLGTIRSMSPSSIYASLNFWTFAWPGHCHQFLVSCQHSSCQNASQTTNII